MLSYIIILILFITCYNIYVHPLDNNTKNILYSIIAIIILVQIQYLRQNSQRNNENFTTGQTDAEAIATIASMYNNGVLNIPKLNVTGDMAVGGQLVVTKDIGTLANLNVNGLSTLSGIANHNGMTTDGLRTNTMNFDGSADYPSGFSLYLYKDSLRFYSPANKSYLSFQPSGSNSMTTEYYNSDNNQRVIV